LLDIQLKNLEHLITKRKDQGARGEEPCYIRYGCEVARGCREYRTPFYSFDTQHRILFAETVFYDSKFKEEDETMKQRLIFSSLLALAGLTFIASAQQEIYIEQLHQSEALKPIIRGAMSVKANILGVMLQDKSMKILDLSSLKEKSNLNSVPGAVNVFAFSTSGQTVVRGAADGQVYAGGTGAAGTPKAFSVHSSMITALAVQDESWLFSSASDKTVILSDLVSGNALGTLPTFQEDVLSLALQPGGKNFAVGLASGQVQLYSIGRLEMIRAYSENKEKISVLNCSADGKYIAVGTINGNVMVWNSTSGEVKIKYAQKGAIASIGFDPKTRWVFSTATDSVIKFYDLATLANVKTMTEGGGIASYAEFVNDETLVTASSKGIVKRWKVALTPPDTMNPGIILDPALSSATPAKVFGAEYEIKGYAFDDNELKEVTVNGVPVVLLTLTPTDAPKIPAGMKSVKRFSAVMKLDSVGVNPAVIGVADKAKHAIVQHVSIQRLSNDEAVEVLSPQVNMDIEAVSIPVKFMTWFDVGSYSISVNMVDIVSGQIPEFKVAGDTINDEVPLIAGYNQIQLSITSKSGTKFQKTIGVNRRTSVLADMPSAPAVKKTRMSGSGPQKWAVVVGVSEYKNPGIPSLKYADKDAESLANFLRRPEGGGYDSDHMRVLMNKDATLPNIRDALINFLNQAIDMDLVVIYFAGHGAPEPARPQNMYLLTYDSDPTALGTTAFPMWDIQTVLARYINAKRVVVFTDACHSGGISANFATRGVGTTEQNLVNQYLSDLSKSKEGVVVFTASAAGEVSQEYPEYGHGVFTYFLLEGLEGKADYNNDYTITINEVMQYTEEQVKRKTRGAQNPTRSQTEYDKELTMSLIPH
jgi:uncharacterized caspase-like protein